MPTIVEQFTNNTEALNTLTAQVQAFLSDPIVADRLKQLAIGDLGGAQDGAILRYNAAAAEFRLMNLGIDASFKADLTGIADGFLLKWDAAGGQFIAVSPTAAPIAFEGLTNTPASLMGLGGKILKVKDDESGIEAASAIASGSAQYAPIQKIKVVSGELVSYFAGISEILQQAPLIPQQSGDSAQIIKGEIPSNWVYGQDYYTGSWEPWHALDGEASTYYYYNGLVSHNGEAIATLGYNFSQSTTIGSYTIQSGPTYYPIGWVVEGSNDGMSWNSIHTVSGEAAWSEYESRFYAFSAVVNYQWIRVVFGESNYESPTPGFETIVVAELQFYPGTSPGSDLDIRGDLVINRTSKIFGLAQHGGEIFAVAGFAQESDKLFAINALQRAIVRDVELSQDNYSVLTNLSKTSGQFKFETIIREFAGRIVANPVSGLGYVAIDDRIFVYQLTSGNLMATIDCVGNDRLQGMAVSGNKLYACAAGLSTIVVVDLLTHSIDAVLTSAEGVGVAPWEAAVHSSQGNVYITFKDSNQVGVFDVVTDSLITTIPVGAKPTGIAISETLDRAVVVNSAGGIISIINTTSNTVIASVPVGVSARPSAAAIDAAHNKAFVACEGYHQVVVVDLVDNSLESRIPVEPEPVDLVWVEATNELYCSSQNGTLTVLSRV